ncbi:MAG: Gfo/Idh/MocA family oxidoreductase [Chloroflexi bacterium]|nr:Gfo/Idh/MocA family oxidoreductase [Chloroflexota bacterium]
MSEQKGFKPVPGAIDAPEIGVGMLGYAFMGRAHSNAFKKLPYMMFPPPAIPKLVALCGRDEKAVATAAHQFGYQGYYTDWRDMLADDNIQMFDNGGPNDTHAAPCILAAQAGKHVFCEKPLARTAEEAKGMLDAVQRANVKHMVAFNYRFVPAVRQAYELIRSGALGEIYHFRAMYLQDWLIPSAGTPWLWRMNKEVAGTGAIGDLASHIIDLGRFLVGAEIKTVGARTRTFVSERRKADGSGMGRVDVDDAFAAVIEFENGVLGTLEGSRFATGRKNYNVIEINGEKGSIHWNLERLNELEVLWVDDDPKETVGFHTTNITEGHHPWIAHWWPPGHIIGWEHTFVHEIAHFLDCIVNGKDVAPWGADFVDGYRGAVVADAIVESARTGQQIDCSYD